MKCLKSRMIKATAGDLPNFSPDSAHRIRGAFLQENAMRSSSESWQKSSSKIRSFCSLATGLPGLNCRLTTLTRHLAKELPKFGLLQRKPSTTMRRNGLADDVGAQNTFRKPLDYDGAPADRQMGALRATYLFPHAALSPRRKRNTE